MTENGHEPKDLYRPSPDVVANASVKSYEELAEWAGRDLEGFWAAQAEEFVWFQKWDKVLDDSKKPFYQWFVGGTTAPARSASTMSPVRPRRSAPSPPA